MKVVPHPPGSRRMVHAAFLTLQICRGVGKYVRNVRKDQGFSQESPKLPKIQTHTHIVARNGTNAPEMHALRRLDRFPPIHHLPLLNEYSPSFHALWAWKELWHVEELGAVVLRAVRRPRRPQLASAGFCPPQYSAPQCFCGLILLHSFAAARSARATWLRLGLGLGVGLG